MWRFSLETEYSMRGKKVLWYFFYIFFIIIDLLIDWIMTWLENETECKFVKTIR